MVLVYQIFFTKREKKINYLVRYPVFGKNRITRYPAKVESGAPYPTVYRTPPGPSTGFRTTKSLRVVSVTGGLDQLPLLLRYFITCFILLFCFCCSFLLPILMLLFLLRLVWLLFHLLRSFSPCSVRQRNLFV